MFGCVRLYYGVPAIVHQLCTIVDLFTKTLHACDTNKEADNDNGDDDIIWENRLVDVPQPNISNYYCHMKGEIYTIYSTARYMR